MAGPTNLGYGPQFTGFVGGSHNASENGGAAGAVQVIGLSADDLGAGLTDSVAVRFKAPFKFRILKVTHDNQSVTDTCTFDLYNGTDSAAVIADVTLTSATAGEVTTFSTSAAATVDEDDALQLRVTTQATTGAIEGLKVWLTVVMTVPTTDNQI